MTHVNWAFLRACFLGGAVGVAVAYFMTPALWWVGLVSGFATGYLGYEFRETLSTTRTVFKKSGTVTALLLRKTVGGFRAADVASQTMTIIWWLSTFGFAVVFVWYAPPRDLGFWIYGWFLVLFLSAIVSSLVTGLLAMTTNLLMILGALIVAQEYWDEYNIHRFWMFGSPLAIEQVKERGFTHKAFTHGNIARWMLLGVGAIIWFSCFYLWYWIITRGVPEIAQMLWEVLRAIHSKERMLCGLDGAAGSAIAYLFFSGMLEGVGITSPIVVVLLGGLSGAVFGTVHWRLARLVFSPKLSQ